MMTYEEAKERVRKAAGDYRTIAREHALNSALVKTSRDELMQKLQDIVSPLSLSPIQFQSINNEHYIWVGTGYEGGTMNLSMPKTLTKEDACKELRQRIEYKLTSIIGHTANYHARELGLKGTQQLCSYALLVLNNLTQDVLASIVEVSRDLDTAEQTKVDLARNYENYCTQLSLEMEVAANHWLAQTTIVPGMKLSIRDLRTVNTSGKSEVRTVKRVADTTGAIYFKETASIVTDRARIYPLGSWLINEPEFAEIEKVLNLLETIKQYR